MSVSLHGGGEPARLVGLAVDLNRRVEIDASLRRSERRYRTFVQSSAQAFWVSDPRGRVVELSDSWVTLTGHSKQSALGYAFNGLILAEDFAPILDDWRRAVDEGRSYEAEFRLRHADGRLLYLRSRSVPVLDEDGHVQERIGMITDMTESREADAARRASEERFRRLSEASFEGIVITERGLIRDNNARLAEMFGYGVDELYGLPARVLIAPASHADVRGRLIDQDAGPYEVEAIRKDGARFDVELRNRMIPVGQRLMRITVVHDITERKRAERALHDSEERFRLLADAAWEAIALVDAGIVMDANPQLAAIFGYEPEEVRGMPVSRMIPPGSLEIVQDHQRRQSPEPYEHEGIRKDGSTVWLEARGRTVPYKGRTIRMTAIRDISERKRADAALRALVAGTAGVSGVNFFHFLTRHLASAFRMKAAFVAELVPSANARLKVLSVWSQHRENMPHFEYDLAGTASERALREGLFHANDGLAGRYSNQEVIREMGVMSYLGMPMFDADRRPLGVLAVLHDQPFEATENLKAHLAIFAARAGVELERIRAEAQVRRLNAELEERVADRTVELRAANHELEAFSYSVSHDLRAPLRHVAGFVSLLEREAAGGLSESAREYLQEIAGSASRMQTLIDVLLEFSRVGRADLLKADTDLGDVAREAIAEAARDAEGRDVEWIIGALPQVRCDARLMRQVLSNLVANAVKYTRPRTTAVIELGMLPGGPCDEVICFVRDNGVGFDMKYARKLFGVFQRLHPVSAFEGNGIGLANVQRIVHRHGGRTWATGAVNGGATFFFSLPVHDEATPRGERHD